MGLLPSGPDRAVVDPPRGITELLPWRRLGDFAPEIGPVIRRVRHHHPRADVRPIADAYSLARRVHEGQTRKSGDPYVTHCVAVAGILADLGMDVSTVCAALLHDAVEDTPVEIEDVAEQFGDEVAAVVDGVTKLDRLRFDTKEAHQAATMRKMLVAMAKDLRVLVIKLADRLHNMRTLAPLAESKRRRIAQETLDIYGPLAHRLGIREIRWQLEDLAFQELQPKAYHEIDQLVQRRHEAREEDLARVVVELQEALSKSRIKASVTGRPKHYYSIYQKMVLGQRSFDEIHDLVGVRIITETAQDCYASLGTVHGLWKPVLGRFKDFIAMPKFNLYQSLHTTVIGPGGRPVEVQIRTQAMNRTAEYGIAAHWRYKESEHAGQIARSDELAWIGRIMEWQETTEDPREFMDALKGDLFQDEVFVFTPKGDVISLPNQATPVDFAYAIHTEVGHRCIGARVNGELVPLDCRLSSGDSVEVFTSKLDGAGPSRDWLHMVATARARNRIRAWFSRERREEAVDRGLRRLETFLRGKGVDPEVLESTEMEQVAEEMNYTDLGNLYQAVGEGHVRPETIWFHIGRLTEPLEESAPAESIAGVTRRSRSAESLGVHVGGLDDVTVRLAGCCNPKPGDEIVGYLTRGKGVAIHRNDCIRAAEFVKIERLVDVAWDVESRSTTMQSIQIEALDRHGLLADVTKVLSDSHVDIRSAQTMTGKDQIAFLRFDFEIADISQMDAVLDAVRELDSVFEVFPLHLDGDGGEPDAEVHGY
ncbi:MAG: bifunctional (p)ppGpp synthetase/guanosine-3',5'-bis(diphosphate) 3'-pyrophosphohydrolase [Actinobacteria bacterium ATB1]|nr:bifunctional (p)ppGpp synthetase/guanosine-3',5'-bis(diphosphate) 3'-pyrophosphohydrolase [Actinobacteria bacterium ATB1]